MRRWYFFSGFVIETKFRKSNKSQSYERIKKAFPIQSPAFFHALIFLNPDIEQSTSSIFWQMSGFEAMTLFESGMKF